ncbi:MAG: mechanosensitive ion channel [Deltaproteobacteria bacterium]|nr:mechanosensitive ion channel [Deltaproteobacteria bacterium]
MTIRALILVLFWVLVGEPSLALAQNDPTPATPTDQAASSGAAKDPATTPNAASEASTPAPEPPPATVDPQILSAPVDDGFLRQIWITRAKDLYQMALEAATVVDASVESGTLSGQLASANLEFTRLMRLFQITRAYPAQQEDLLRQIRGLRVKLSQELAALDSQKSLISQRLEEAASLKKDLAGLVFDPKDDPGPRQSLEEASKLLTRTEQKLNLVLDPGHILQTNLDAAVLSIEKSVPQTWRDYYLTSLSASGQGFGAVANLDLIFKWTTSMRSMSLFIWPQTGSSWLEAALKFLVAFGITALLGELVRRAFVKSKLAWKEGLTKIIKGSWLWLIFGFALLVGSLNSLGGSYLALKLPGVLALLWGLAAISWRLRVAAQPKLEGHPSPLARFFPPAAIGIIFLFLDCPAGPMTVLWALIMVLFLVWSKKSKKTGPDLGTMTALEGLYYSSAVYFSLASLLTTILGYPRLAILVFMLLFTLVNFMILASALISLGATLTGAYFDQTDRPIRKAIANSLTIPLGVLLALVSAVPWLWTAPGLEYLLLNVLRKGYTVGDASFELSRILLIVFLFFLFRSFVAFGQTSLEQMPKTFVGLEKGVIPPLKVLFTYLVWVVYVLIALSLLGVNFTSLAVVAGGLSVGVGLGLQAIFGNLVSGLILMFGRTIMVGDLVEVGGVLGTVRSVDIRSTQLETAEKAVVYVPNSNIMSGQFVNWTRNHRQVRRKLTVQTCYGIDIALALTTMKEVALAHERVVAGDPPLALFSEFGDNSLIFTLLVTIVDVDFGLSTLSAIRQEIERRFKDLGITIYNPCLEVTLANPKPPKSLEVKS